MTAAENSRPAVLRAQLRAGDLVAHFDHARPGELTVCAVNFSGDWMDAAFRERWQSHLAKIPFSCTHVAPRAALAVLEVQPRQRFDR